MNMDRLRYFDFFTIMLPGLIFVGFMCYLWLGDDFFTKDGPFLRLATLLLPAYLFFGNLFSILGKALEGWIDQLTNKSTVKHPLVNIIPENYGFVEAQIYELFPSVKLKDGSKDEKYYDAIFEKCRVLVYQQTYGDRPQSIATLATLYRNLMGVFICTLIIIISLKFVGNLSHTYLNESQYFIITIVVLVLLVYYSRIISQKLYFYWFHDVLKNTEVYFQTLKNFKKDGKKN